MEVVSQSDQRLVRRLVFVMMVLLAVDTQAAPRHQAMECRGGGAMSAEYQDRRGSTHPVVKIRFIRAPGRGELARGQCRLRQGNLKSNDPTVLVYRAKAEKITQIAIAPSPSITGVVGPGLRRLIEHIQNGLPFTVWVSNSGRGWWEIQRLNP